MALIKCKECNAQISDKAEACPKCGAPVERKNTFECFECKTMLEAGTKICSNCGAEQEMKNEPGTSLREAQKPSEDTGKGSSKKLFLYIALAAAVLLIIILIVFLKPFGGNSAAMAKADSTRIADSVANAANAAYASVKGDSTRKADSAKKVQDSLDAVSRNRHDNRTSNGEDAQQQAQAQWIETMIDQEQNNPTDYVTATYSIDYGVFSGKDIVNIKLKNSALYTNYKNINMRLTFYTATDVVLGTKDYTCYQYLNSGASINTQIKDYSPGGTKKIGLAILGAEISQ